MNEALGSRIKAIRSAKRLTQEQVADQIGVSRQKYARIESGANSITFDILSKVADVLGVTVGDITKVLDETPAAAYRSGEERESSIMILLFLRTAAADCQEKSLRLPMRSAILFCIWSRIVLLLMIM